MENLPIIAMLTIASGTLSLLCLLVLHFVSPEFKPNWRMVNEYANGKHKWLLTLMFIFWSACSLFAAYLLWNLVTTRWAIFGVVLVFVSGIGALMGTLFDIKHKLHGLSFMLGIPTLPIGALLISYYLAATKGWSDFQPYVILSAHSIWISLVLMGVSMGLMFSGFKKAGVVMDKDAEPPKEVPKGVIAVGGYANRLLIVCYIGWLMLIAKIYLTL
ncbi:MAG: DUF998 domain-containing protein [Cyclobacteriaceae bacterium]|nr:DUF998 domain-containing protein [Cyclobacteriaceae bacterium]